jgi:transcriptional regulator with XRE-family HTH domain
MASRLVRESLLEVGSGGEALKVSELVGHNVRALRQAAGLTQDELAAAMQHLGLRWVRQTVAETEAGRREPTIAELVAIAGYFEMPLHALLLAPGGQIPTDEIEVGGRTVPIGMWAGLVTNVNPPNTPPEPIAERAIDALTSGLERPWAEAWRAAVREWKEKDLSTDDPEARPPHPEGSFARSWEELTSKRRPYPGPTFLYEGEGELVQSFNLGPWARPVYFRLTSGEPYVARNDVEAERLLQLAEAGTVRKISRQEAYRLRKRKGN